MIWSGKFNEILNFKLYKNTCFYVGVLYTGEYAFIFVLLKYYWVHINTLEENQCKVFYVLSGSGDSEDIWEEGQQSEECCCHQPLLPLLPGKILSVTKQKTIRYLVQKVKDTDVCHQVYLKLNCPVGRTAQWQSPFSVPPCCQYIL